MKLRQFVLVPLSAVKSLAWNMARFPNSNPLDAIKTFIYPRVTVCQVLLGITYHASCLKSNIVSRRRIGCAPVSSYPKTILTVNSSLGHAVATHRNTMMRGRISIIIQYGPMAAMHVLHFFHAVHQHLASIRSFTISQPRLSALSSMLRPSRTCAVTYHFTMLRWQPIQYHRKLSLSPLFTPIGQLPLTNPQRQALHPYVD